MLFQFFISVKVNTNICTHRYYIYNCFFFAIFECFWYALHNIAYFEYCRQEIMIFTTRDFTYDTNWKSQKIRMIQKVPKSFYDGIKETNLIFFLPLPIQLITFWLFLKKVWWIASVWHQPPLLPGNPRHFPGMFHRGQRFILVSFNFMFTHLFLLIIYYRLFL